MSDHPIADALAAVREGIEERRASVEPPLWHVRTARAYEVVARSDGWPVVVLDNGTRFPVAPTMIRDDGASSWSFAPPPWSTAPDAGGGAAVTDETVSTPHPVDRHIERVAALAEPAVGPFDVSLGGEMARQYVEEPPPKRKRRTKAEMAEYRALMQSFTPGAVAAREDAERVALPDAMALAEPTSIPAALPDGAWELRSPPRRPTVAEIAEALDNLETPAEATPSSVPPVGVDLTPQESAMPDVSRLEFDVPASEYHVSELGAASSSALKELARSPAHYREWLAQPSRQTPAMAFGSAVHARVLEPAKFAAEYVVRPPMPDGRTAAGKDARAAFEATVGDRTPLDQDDADTIEAIRAALLRHPIAARLLTARDGVAEVTARWHDGPTGVKCRARVDLWIPSLAVAVDLKTTTDASPKEFAKSVANYSYGIQQAHYVAGLEACGARVEAFLFVAVERTRPYGVSVFQLDTEAVEHSRERRAGLLEVKAQYLHVDRWPSYSDGIQTLSLPRWATQGAP